MRSHTRSAVVIGSTSDALVHAAWLAHHGVAVRFFGLHSSHPGGGDPVPFGVGAIRSSSPEIQSEIRMLWGELEPPPGPREVAIDGARVPLNTLGISLGRRAWVRVSGGGAGSYAELARRAWSSRADRTVRHWVEARFGTSWQRLEPLLYGWLHHPRRGSLWIPRLSSSQLRARWNEQILDAGGEVLSGVRVDTLELGREGVEAVLTDHGREWVEGSLWIDTPPMDVSAWLPEDVPWDLRCPDLTFLHGIQVTLEAAAEELPWCLDLWEPGSAWRITRPVDTAERVTVHFTLGSHDALWKDEEALVLAARNAVHRWAPSTGDVVGIRRALCVRGVPRIGCEQALARWKRSAARLGIEWIGPRSAVLPGAHRGLRHLGGTGERQP